MLGPPRKETHAHKIEVTRANDTLMPEIYNKNNKNTAIRNVS